MDQSFFMDKAVKPVKTELERSLGKSYSLWSQIRARVLLEYPAGLEEWNYPGKKYAWSFRPRVFMQRVVVYGFLFRMKIRLKIFFCYSKSSLPIKIIHYFYRLIPN